MKEYVCAKGLLCEALGVIGIDAKEVALPLNTLKPTAAHELQQLQQTRQLL
jgi:hypothetical protein